MITFFFGVLCGVCLMLALLEIARTYERYEDRRVNAQRFDAPTHAGKL